MKVGIVGGGRIGSELYKQIKPLGWKAEVILKNDGVYKNLTEKIDELENYQKHCENLNMAFIAIPTLDDGKTAFNYISYFIEQNIPVVTCEKGALSNYYAELENKIDKIGYSATVGGGTRLLKYLEEKMNPNVEQIHAVINGTLNYLFDELSKGKNLEKVAEEARKLGYTEPGAEKPLEIINKEATEDAPMKTSILFNVCKTSRERVRAKQFNTSKITEPELKELTRQAKNRRYIVSITKEKNEEDVIGGFNYQAGEWAISAGFKNISENPLYQQLITRGVNNSILIQEEYNKIKGIYTLTGPGAGAEPTTSSMIKDAYKIFQKQTTLTRTTYA